jgi:uncharacterized protein (TIGR03084 family)
VRTFRFSFANRGLPVPEARPRIVLAAPSGARWRWEGDAGAVEGAAEDFCLVTTQRRHVDDTGLVVTGPVAERWMAVAQCIAGPALPGPAPGERVWT